MSSTNKTTNYELSQYVGTDKPTYLGDYNGDMLKIDTQMKANADNISTVSSTASTASTNASTALTNANTAQTTAETAQSTANTAQSTASTANITAQQALSNTQLLNLTNFASFTPTEMTASVGTFNANSKLNCASNSDGSIGKIYGWANLTGTETQSGTTSTITFTTALRPTETINIEGLAIRQYVSGGNVSSILKADVSISTAGLVTISFPTNTTMSSVSIFLPACLLFMKNFGDVQSQSL